ncbi:MAG: hypothetical protein WC081_02780 [Candidatus Ratteibacteria bacterium]
MAIFDELKTIGKVLQEAGKIELYQQILEVQNKLIEMQKKIIDLENKNRELKDELTLKKNLIFERNAYWVKRGNDEKDGPFCSHCYDDCNKLIRMRTGNYEFGWAYCPKCTQITPE